MTLSPETLQHRADVRAALERDIATILRREQHDIPNPEGVSALIVRELSKKGWA